MIFSMLHRSFWRRQMVVSGVQDVYYLWIDDELWCWTWRVRSSSAHRWWTLDDCSYNWNEACKSSSIRQSVHESIHNGQSPNCNSPQEPAIKIIFMDVQMQCGRYDCGHWIGTWRITRTLPFQPKEDDASSNPVSWVLAIFFSNEKRAPWVIRKWNAIILYCRVLDVVAGLE